MIKLINNKPYYIYINGIAPTPAEWRTFCEQWQRKQIIFLAKIHFNRIDYTAEPITGRR